MAHGTAMKVGMREFREQLAAFLEGEAPVAVTKHGRTVGVYIPVRGAAEAADRAALHEAGQRLDAWLADQGLDEETLVTEFKAARKNARTRGR